MSPLLWMAGAAVLLWLVMAVAGGAGMHPEALYAMLGPLAAACGTWVVTERTYRRHPERLTGIMVAGLLVKALFFGAYVIVMLRTLGVRPQPFVASFTVFFIGLYGLEALFLKRLFRS